MFLVCHFVLSPCFPRLLATALLWSFQQHPVHQKDDKEMKQRATSVFSFIELLLLRWFLMNAVT